MGGVGRGQRDELWVQARALGMQRWEGAGGRTPGTGPVLQVYKGGGGPVADLSLLKTDKPVPKNSLCTLPLPGILACICTPVPLPVGAAADKPLTGAMDKMKNMAVKRDEIRKSFIGDPTQQAAADVVAGEEDLSAFL